MDFTHFWKYSRKIIGIGRNYAAHAKELDNPVPSEVVIFTKPLTALIQKGSPIVIPRGAIVHHELELGIIIGSKGKRIPVEKAEAHIAGYCLALDMTARNFQERLKKNGLPWDRAKGWDTSCPVGPFVPVKDLPRPANMWLRVNNELRQRASTSEMLVGIEQLVVECSNVMTLEPGDLILTGTPSGVSEVHSGDVITCGIDGVCEDRWEVETER